MARSSKVGYGASEVLLKGPHARFTNREPVAPRKSLSWAGIQPLPPVPSIVQLTLPTCQEVGDTFRWPRHRAPFGVTSEDY
jgi:hypothetical protein